MEGKEIGVSTDEEGRFEIKENITGEGLVFSAVGYETKMLRVDSVSNEIYIQPLIMMLDEISVSASKKSKRRVVDPFKRKNINTYFCSGETPWMIAQFFKWEDSYQETPFLKKIILFTQHEIPEAKFQIRLYSVGEVGQPQNYLYPHNIIGTAKKGSKKTEIDVEKLNISFPPEGFFVVFEWLVFPANKRVIVAVVKETNEKMTMIWHGPSVGLIKAEPDEVVWTYKKGIWNRAEKSINGSLKKIAMTLVLTN